MNTANQDHPRDAVIFIGAQATGKSTFYVEQFFRTHVRINLDMLRTRAREQRLIEACFAAGQSFVVDNTNPRREDRARYIPRARLYGFRVIGYFFASSMDDILRRNALRSGRERIPPAGIRATFAKVEPPTVAEGFDELYRVSLSVAGFEIAPWEQ